MRLTFDIVGSVADYSMIDQFFVVLKYLLGASLFGVGAVAFACAVRGLRLGRASFNWPSTHGIVIDSHVVKSRSTKSGGGTSYYPQVKYRFEVDGNEYEVDVWTYHALEMSKKIAEEICERYSKGREVMVYYDPENPRHAVLKPGVNTGNYFICFVITILLAVVGLLIITGVI